MVGATPLIAEVSAMSLIVSGCFEKSGTSMSTVTEPALRPLDSRTPTRRL